MYLSYLYDNVNAHYILSISLSVSPWLPVTLWTSAMHATLWSRLCRTCSRAWYCCGVWSWGKSSRGERLTLARAADTLLPLSILKAPRCVCYKTCCLWCCGVFVGSGSAICMYYFIVDIFIHSWCVCVQILRHRVLEFLVPLSGQYGVQMMASLGVVWSSRKSKRRHKNKVRPTLCKKKNNKGQVTNWL